MGNYENLDAHLAGDDIDATVQVGSQEEGRKPIGLLTVVDMTNRRDLEIKVPGPTAMLIGIDLLAVGLIQERNFPF